MQSGSFPEGKRSGVSRSETKADVRDPIPRDERGWNVAPAPDGRGMPDQPKGRPPHRRLGFLWFVVALIALNWASVLLFKPAGQPRVRVPFSPYFLQEVKAGQVRSISSRGDTIEGTFTTKLRYPPDDRRAKPTTLFKTEVPTFWNDNELAALLQSKSVQINAKSTSNGTSLLAELLLGFGPTLLIVGLFILVARRAARGGGVGALGDFGRPRARRGGPHEVQVAVAAGAGLDEGQGDLTESVDVALEPERLG